MITPQVVVSCLYNNGDFFFWNDGTMP